MAERPRGAESTLEFLKGLTGAAQSLGRQKVAAEQIEREEDQRSLENARQITAQLLRERQAGEQIRQFDIGQQFDVDEAAREAEQFGQVQDIREREEARNQATFNSMSTHCVRTLTNG